MLVGDLEEEDSNNDASKSQDGYQQSIASLDSVAENADFISLQNDSIYSII